MYRRQTTLFQFSPLREGRLVAADVIQPFVRFQFSPLREGRRSGSGSQYVTFVFQFSPLREGRQRLFRALDLGDSISILAPARGATNQLPKQQYGCFISILAPARGATISRRGNSTRSGYFNSRPCERGDPFPCSLIISSNISILAPARGATKRKNEPGNTRTISILAPARGATRSGSASVATSGFQFSPLREGRQ